jgi:hypothetical protein
LNTKGLKTNYGGGNLLSTYGNADLQNIQESKVIDSGNGRKGILKSTYGQGGTTQTTSEFDSSGSKRTTLNQQDLFKKK